MLVRHGESTWNEANLFTGWADPGLSPRGEEEALCAGQLMMAEGIQVDTAFVSRLARADETLHILLDALGQRPAIVQSWRVNEQHCGDLTGMNKRELALRYGESQIWRYRRDPRVRPPPASDLLPETVERLGSRIARVEQRRLCKVLAPRCESMYDVVRRFAPLWRHGVVPLLRRGQTVLIVGHGNVLRGAIAIVEGLTDVQLSRLELPQATPIVYEWDECMRLAAGPDDMATAYHRGGPMEGLRSVVLGDPVRVREAQAKSAAAHSQGPLLQGPRELPPLVSRYSVPELASFAAASAAGGRQVWRPADSDA